MNTKTPAFTPSPDVLAEAKRQHAILSEGVEAIYPAKGQWGPDGLFDKLVVALSEKRPLTIKFGMDPTAPDLHLGHTVVLNSLRKFQDLGHMALPLIGNYTALIGDPSGRNSTRPPLTEEQIAANAKTYLEQVYKVVDQNPKKCKLMWNGEWLEKLTFAETIKLCAQVTVAQITAREDFAKRLYANEPISMHELLYPIMQGYDSVAMQPDIEFGGTDQTFNCLMGRQLMSAKGMEPQIVMTFPLLEGLDGVIKMSKSKGNYIGVEETPENMFGKTMRIPDSLLDRWFSLLTTIPEGARPRHPMEAKKMLAEFITARFHGDASARDARESFDKQFSKRETLDNIASFYVPTSETYISVSDSLISLGYFYSKSEIKRAITAKSIKIDDVAISSPDYALRVGDTFKLRAGKVNRTANIIISQSIGTKFDDVFSQMKSFLEAVNNNYNHYEDKKLLESIKTYFPTKIITMYNEILDHEMYMLLSRYDRHFNKNLNISKDIKFPSCTNLSSLIRFLNQMGVDEKDWSNTNLLAVFETTFDWVESMKRLSTLMAKIKPHPNIIKSSGKKNLNAQQELTILLNTNQEFSNIKKVIEEYDSMAERHEIKKILFEHKEDPAQYASTRLRKLKFTAYNMRQAFKVKE